MGNRGHALRSSVETKQKDWIFKSRKWHIHCSLDHQLRRNNILGIFFLGRVSDDNDIYYWLFTSTVAILCQISKINDQKELISYSIMLSACRIGNCSRQNLEFNDSQSLPNSLKLRERTPSLFLLGKAACTWAEQTATHTYIHIFVLLHPATSTHTHTHIINLCFCNIDENW